MLSALDYDSAAGLLLRIRNADRDFLDFVTGLFVSVESADTKLLMGETANGDGMSLYTLTVTLPAGGPFVQQVILPTGEVIATGDAVEPPPSLAQIESSTVLAKEATVQSIADIADPLATVIEGSDPPMTRGEAIDQLYVPDYIGPVVVVPANTDHDTQFLHVYGKQGDGTASAARRITAVPAPGQIIDQCLIDKQVLAETLDADGYAFLTLIRGIRYVISASWWGSSAEITVTDVASSTFAAYLAPPAEPEV